MCNKMFDCFSVLDQDIIAHRVPKGAVGFHIYQGPLGMDFRVGGLCCCRQLRAYLKLVIFLTKSSLVASSL